MRILPEVHTYGFYTGADGFYTGYYEAEVAGSRVKTDGFNVPLYSVPASIAGKRSKVFSQFDRNDIEDGALAGKGLEICWIKNPIDAFFAQIQGSTRVKLDDGELLRLNYIASNGKPYTPVGRFLIDRGIIARRHVDGQDSRLHGGQSGRGQGAAAKNRSFVFFPETQLGREGRVHRRAGHSADAGAFARGRSLDPRLRHADLDRRRISDQRRKPQDTFQHLMFAQDTGSAIRGAARADIYFGHGEDIRAHRRPHQAVRPVRHAGAEDVSVNGTSRSRHGIPLPQPRPKDIVADNAGDANRDLAKPAMSPGRQPAPRSHPGRTRAVDDLYQGDRAVSRGRALRRR